MFLNRLLLRSYLFVSLFRRGVTFGVRVAVFDAEGRVFLVKHSYMPGWYLPGGGVDRGETVRQALDRELMEEAGIRPSTPATLFGLYLNRHVSPRDQVALYVCRDWTQPAPPKVPNLEIVACGFYAPDALPEGVTAATRRRLAEIAGAEAPSPEW